MKKLSFFSPLFLLTLLFVGFGLFSEVRAQNIGSLASIVSPGFSFRKDLKLGDTDPDVKELQKVLNADIDTTIAFDGAGSPGAETTYFGQLTRLAVIKFQNKYRDTILTPYNLSAGTGLVSKSTRTKLNLLLGVMNTYDSVGLPQSSQNIVSRSVSIPIEPNLPPPPPSSSQMSICQFINLLSSIQVLEPSVVVNARNMYSCSGTTTTTSSPVVDLRVNGRSDRITLSSPANVNISWTSSNAVSCFAGTTPKPLSGSSVFYAASSGNIMLSCTGPGGTVTDSVRVIVDDDLSVSCSATTTANNTVRWEANAEGGTDRYSYSWSGDFSGNSRVMNKSYTQAGTKNATVRVTSGSLSASASCSASVGTLATTTPSLQVSCTANPSSVTSGNSVGWTATPTGGNGTYTYSWSGADNLTGNSQSLSKTYPTAGTKNATVTVTSGSLTASNTCNATVNQTNVVSTTTLQVSCSPITSPVTLETPVNWAAVVSGGNGTYTYSWSGSQNLYGSNMFASKTYSTAGTKNATVTVTSGPLTQTGTRSAVVEEVIEEPLPLEEGAGPERHFYFGGLVTEVLACESGTTQVVLSPCSPGQPLSSNYVDGSSNVTNAGYIVIRDGMQSIPSVGQSVLGVVVDDMGLTCSGATVGYIGTVTGELGIGGSCVNDLNEDEDDEEDEEESYFDYISKIIGDIFMEEVGNINWTDTITNIGSSVGTSMGEFISW